MRFQNGSSCQWDAGITRFWQVPHPQRDIPKLGDVESLAERNNDLCNKRNLGEIEVKSMKVCIAVAACLATLLTSLVFSPPEASAQGAYECPHDWTRSGSKCFRDEWFTRSGCPSTYTPARDRPGQCVKVKYEPVSSFYCPPYVYVYGRNWNNYNWYNVGDTGYCFANTSYGTYRTVAQKSTTYRYVYDYLPEIQDPYTVRRWIDASYVVQNGPQKPDKPWLRIGSRGSQIKKVGGTTFNVIVSGYVDTAADRTPFVSTRGHTRNGTWNMVGYILQGAHGEFLEVQAQPKIEWDAWSRGNRTGIEVDSSGVAAGLEWRKDEKACFNEILTTRFNRDWASWRITEPNPCDIKLTAPFHAVNGVTVRHTAWSNVDVLGHVDTWPVRSVASRDL